MKRLAIALAFVALTAAAGLALAPPSLPEKPSMPLAALQAHSAYIVIGKALRTYESKEPGRDFNRAHYVIEIEVTGVEKAPAYSVEMAKDEAPSPEIAQTKAAERRPVVAKGDVIHVRYSTMHWCGRGDPPAYATGFQTWTPKDGQECRAYIRQSGRHGTFDLQTPNGIAKLD